VVGPLQERQAAVGNLCLTANSRRQATAARL